MIQVPWNFDPSMSRYPQLWRGCVGAWYPGAGPQGATLRDFSRYRNHGTLTGFTLSSAWGVGQHGTQIDFPGSCYVDVADNPAFDVGTGPYGISLWIRSTVTPSRNYFAAGKLLNAHPYDGPTIGLTSSGYATFLWRSGAFNYQAAGTTDLTDGTWNHLFGQRIGTTIYCYVNGKQVAATTNAAIANNPDNDQPFCIGRERSGTTNEEWIGQICEVALFAQQKSESDIRILSQRPGIMYEQRERRVYSLPSAAAGSPWYQYHQQQAVA